jgi:hypothetical protein
MNHKDKIHGLLDECAQTMLAFIRDRESMHVERWVPAVEIKDVLQLNLVPYPKNSGHDDGKGWFFAILARKLEDAGTVEYKREGNRAYYRSAKLK